MQSGPDKGKGTPHISVEQLLTKTELLMCDLLSHGNLIF